MESKDGKEEKKNPTQALISLSKTYVAFNKPDWENTKNYDEVMVTIGRSRKLIFSKFLNLEQRKVKITYEVARDVLKEILGYCKIKVEDKNWPVLILFAERDGIIDFRMLLDVYRQRVNKLLDAPRSKVIFI